MDIHRHSHSEYAIYKNPKYVAADIGQLLERGLTMNDHIIIMSLGAPATAAHEIHAEWDRTKDRFIQE